MKRLPLNIQTLYADLQQSLGGHDAASIIKRESHGAVRLYARKRGKPDVYLGTEGDPKAEANARSYRAAQQREKDRRKTITAIKATGVPAPDAMTGRVIKVMSDAGLFDRGAVLVGTAAFQIYHPIVGSVLPSAALMTQDADLAVARIAVQQMQDGPQLVDVLKNADPTFELRLHRGHKHAFQFESARSFMVDVLTTPGRTDEPVEIKGLGCGAQPLKFMDYLIEQPIEAVALIGSGVRVVVPQPIRYALHKLIVAQRRPAGNVKVAKDLRQAAGLLEALRDADPHMVDDAIEDARDRGKAWKKLINDGLKLSEAYTP